MRLMCDSCMHAVSVPLLRFLQPRRPVCLLLAAFQTNGHLPKCSGFFSPANFHIDKRESGYIFTKGRKGQQEGKKIHTFPAALSFLRSAVGKGTLLSCLVSRVPASLRSRGALWLQVLSPPPPLPQPHTAISHPSIPTPPIPTTTPPTCIIDGLVMAPLKQDSNLLDVLTTAGGADRGEA